MWSIKGVKAEAKQLLKRNYWALVFICAVLLFLSVIPGNGMEFSSMSTTAITGETTQSDTGTGEEYQSGLVRYLGSMMNGDSKEKRMAIAQDVMNSFNGLGGNAYAVFRAVDQFFFANETAAKILIVVSIIIYLLFAYVVRNLLLVGWCRIGIDAGNPEYKVHFGDLFAIFRTNGYLNTTGVMILSRLILDVIIIAGVGLMIAGLTIMVNGAVGVLSVVLLLTGLAISIYYIYRDLVWIMVPYILASNPTTPFRECIALSKEMMKNNKWKFVLLRLSYIGWDLLSIVTLGLVNLFYITPATYLAYSRVYMKLREKAIAENMPYAYRIEGDNLSQEPAALKPNKFGKMISDRNPERHYSLINLILLFFIFAFIGWCWEVMLHIIKDGVFINRGTMHGPWLPIYGFGGAGIIAFLRRFAKRPFIMIVCIFVGCGILEYITHWYLEVTKGTKWWDYSNYFLNLNGRICFEGLFVFCIAGVFAVYVAGPALDNLLNRVSDWKKWTVAGILLAIFAADAAYSSEHPNKGKGITDYGKK